MITDINGLINHLTMEIKKQTDVAIIGLSGGADSTLVATLCLLALGQGNVVGVHMPYGKIDTEGTKFNGRSVRFARKLGIREEYIPINGIADAITAAINPEHPDPAQRRWGDTEMTLLDKGNARARARMCVLYGLSGTLSHREFLNKKIRVVGTGNLSEDFIGYDTKGGDSLCDFHPIGRLYKSEVYQLLNHFIEKGIIDEEHVDRVPSAGLWEGQTDEGEIGHSYAKMEPAIKNIISDDRAYLAWHPQGIADEVVNFVYKRHLGNKHKHEAIPSFDVGGFVD